ARQFIGAAATALSLITGAFLLALAAGNARAPGSAPACDAAGGVALLPSPRAPGEGGPPRVLLVAAKPLPREFSLTAPPGRWGAPPGGPARAPRRISGSPRSRRRRRAPGMRRSRPSGRAQDAARSRARSRYVPTSRAGRAPRPGAPGRCATPEIAQPRTCSPPG